MAKTRSGCRLYKGATQCCYIGQREGLLTVQGVQSRGNRVGPVDTAAIGINRSAIPSPSLAWQLLGPRRVLGRLALTYHRPTRVAGEAGSGVQEDRMSEGLIGSENDVVKASGAWTCLCSSGS